MPRKTRPKSPQNRWLRLRQLDERLEPFRPLRNLSPSGGWIREIRDALGMNTSDLARRAGWAQSTVPKIENNEARGRITMETLQKAANALDCDLVYALIPRRALAESLRVRIALAARRRLGRVSRTMALEGQATGKAFEDTQYEDLLREFTVNPPRNIWSDP